MTDKRTFLITGGAGFVGHHMVEHIYKNTSDNIIVVDSLNYSGSLQRLRDININGDSLLADQSRVRVLTWDLRHEAGPNLLSELQEVTHVLHLAAESHVDRSIEDPMIFVESNVRGTVNLLNLARQLNNLEVFVYFSTDEVMGPAPLQKFDINGDLDFRMGFKEDDVHTPKNPYAASKSAAEQFVTAFANTYNLPCMITRQMNIFGERQHPEKFIPLCIERSLTGEKVHIHASKDKTQAGVRSYIHARNVADAHLHLIRLDGFGEFPLDEKVEGFHIVGEEEVDNETLYKLIHDIVWEESGLVDIGGYNYELVDFHSSRPGHDLRYALCGEKMESLGWAPPKDFRESLRKTIKWYLERREK